MFKKLLLLPVMVAVCAMPVVCLANNDYLNALVLWQQQQQLTQQQTVIQLEQNRMMREQYTRETQQQQLLADYKKIRQQRINAIATHCKEINLNAATEPERALCNAVQNHIVYHQRISDETLGL